jgi:hypothetical protein
MLLHPNRTVVHIPQFVLSNLLVSYPSTFHTGNHIPLSIVAGCRPPGTMSFDPFETRLHFLQLLRKLNASQLSIQKVVGYAVKYGSRCGEDLWECITEERAKVGGSSVSIGIGSSVVVPLRRAQRLCCSLLHGTDSDSTR